MIREHNSEREIELRKYQSIMTSVGAGIMMFAVWSFIRMFLLFIINGAAVYQYFIRIAGDEIKPGEAAAYITFVYTILAVFTVVSLICQVYVGSCAVAEGRGRIKRRHLYIVFAVIMIISSAVSICMIIAELITGTDTDVPEEFRTSAVVEFTLMVMLIEMVYASFKVRKLQDAGKHGRE